VVEALSDADEIACAFFKLFDDRGHFDYQGKRIFVTNGALYEHFLKVGIVDKGLGRRGCSTWVRNMVGQGPLADFRPYKGEFTRGVIYSGPQSERESAPVEIAEFGHSA